MGKLNWKAAKVANVPKPNPFPPGDTQPHAPKSKKKGKTEQRFLNKVYSRMARTNKPKTERGEERPESRTHHCGFCGKIFTNICKAKGHMVPCPDHQTIYTLPGKPCQTCNVVDNAETRKTACKEENENDHLQKTRDDAFLLNGNKRKKPGVKPGRPSFDEVSGKALTGIETELKWT
ncbi:MAG: hypothetical protein Q9209_003886 [Squamulea sp. 1 TL-2023]